MIILRGLLSILQEMVVFCAATCDAIIFMIEFVFSLIFVHIQLYLLKSVKLLFVIAVFSIYKQLITKWSRRICLI